jgi:3-methyladenine DNA glycosylase AlkD
MEPLRLAARVRATLRANADGVKAAEMKRYMRDQFAYFGVPTPVRRKLLGTIRDTEAATSTGRGLRTTVDRLWAFPERECQYCAQDLVERYRDRLVFADLAWIEGLIVTKTWWDTVDFLAAKIVAAVLDQHASRARRRKEARRWIRDDNLWLRRTALLFQLKYGRETDTKLLAELIESTEGETEFFIRKAIGWALREYSRTDPDWVRQFVHAHPGLSGLSRREALKRLA